MAIVYIHKRKDNGIIFYVGIGNTIKRAYDIKNRKNKQWINIVKKWSTTVISLVLLRAK